MNILCPICSSDRLQLDIFDKWDISYLCVNCGSNFEIPEPPELSFDEWKKQVIDFAAAWGYPTIMWHDDDALTRLWRAGHEPMDQVTAMIQHHYAKHTHPNPHDFSWFNRIDWCIENEE